MADKAITPNASTGALSSVSSSPYNYTSGIGNNLPTVGDFNGGAISSAANNYNFTSEAGPMTAATHYSPTGDALVSDQLGKLLQSDSSYLTRARFSGEAAAQKRGLANSSISAGASEAAAIDAALPIAQQDANSFFTSQRDNTEADNRFGLARNQFGFDSSLTKYKGALEAAVTGAELDMRNKTLQADVATKGADLNIRERLAANAEKDAASVNDRFNSQQRQNLSSDVAKIRQQAADARVRLESDPNMTKEAKASAITAMAQQAEQDIAEMVRFSGIDLPEAWPDWINQLNTAGVRTETGVNADTSATTSSSGIVGSTSGGSSNAAAGNGADVGSADGGGTGSAGSAGTGGADGSGGTSSGDANDSADAGTGSNGGMDSGDGTGDY